MLDTISSLNWAEIAGVAALAVLIFERVARLTPNKTDDKLVSFVRKLFNILSVNIPDVEKGPEAKK